MKLSAHEKALIEQIPFDKYFNECVAPLTKSKNTLGGRTSVVCPFHNDRNPSFVYYPKTRSFHCFANCHVEVKGRSKKTSGSVIDLHILTEKTYHNRDLTRREAFVELAVKYRKNNLLKLLPAQYGRCSFFEENKPKTDFFSKADEASRTAGSLYIQNTSVYEYIDEVGAKSRRANDSETVLTPNTVNASVSNNIVVNESKEAVQTTGVKAAYTVRNMLRYRKDQAPLIDTLYKTDDGYEWEKNLNALTMLDIEMGMQLKGGLEV